MVRVLDQPENIGNYLLAGISAADARETPEATERRLATQAATAEHARGETVPEGIGDTSSNQHIANMLALQGECNDPATRQILDGVILHDSADSNIDGTLFVQHQANSIEHVVEANNNVVLQPDQNLVIQFAESQQGNHNWDNDRAHGVYKCNQFLDACLRAGHVSLPWDAKNSPTVQELI